MLKYVCYQLSETVAHDIHVNSNKIFQNWTFCERVTGYHRKVIFMEEH